MLLPTIAAAPVKNVRRVLVIYELGLSSPTISLADREIRTALAESPYQVDVYAEYLEVGLFPDAASQQTFRDHYIRKYKDRKPDVIMAVGPAALQFVIESHDRYFPNIPVVFSGTSREQAGNPELNTNYTGAWIVFDFAKTLDVALELLPSTQHVFVVGGTAPFDRRIEEMVRADLHRYEKNIEISYLVDLEMSELLDRLKHLPPHSIILFTTIRQDAEGKYFVTTTQALPMIVAVANAPIFVFADTLMGNGALGGYVHSYAAQGKVAADIALKILGGERPQNIPIQYGSNTYMFDWRVLERWGLKESAVPPGSVALNRQPSLWAAYKVYIIGGVILCVAETFLVFGLLWQRGRRRNVEQSLLELSGRLITAHEEERSRIARELHDDLSQRMALLQIGVEQFERDMPGLSSTSRQQLLKIAEGATEVSSDIHDLSHQLHPAKLDTLGLMAAVGGLCREISRQHDLQIEFVPHDIPKTIPKDVTLCLFRIAQEALRNVVRHSGAREAKLELSATAHEINLCISDSGLGFDLKSTGDSAGIGLISMRERLRLVGGHLSVESEPSHGTRIRVRAPLHKLAVTVTKSSSIGSG
jgi:signal transduction histidine kinase